MDWKEALVQIETLLQQGEEEQARQALEALEVKEIHEGELHLRLAQLAERAGLPRRALLEYNLALRDQADPTEVLPGLIELYQEQGQSEDLEKACRRLLELSPADVETTLTLGALLASLGRTQEAAELYNKFLEQNDEQSVRQALQRLEGARPSPSPAGEDPLLSPGASASPPDEEESARQESPREETVQEESVAWHPSDIDGVAFAHLFGGREGVYARQWRSDTGRHGYTPVYEPFTPTVARNHLLGAYTVGIYPLRMDNTVRFLAFDLDIAKAAMRRQATTGQHQGLGGLLRVVHSVARRLLDAAASYDIPSYLEDSGWKGRHLWIFLEEPLPAASARRLAHLLLHSLDTLPAEVQIEIFPKQSRLQRSQLGNLIKLPLGIHRVTGRRCAWLDAEGRSLPRPFAQLHRLRRLSRQQVLHLLAQAEAEARWRSAHLQADPSSVHSPSLPSPGALPDASTHTSPSSGNFPDEASSAFYDGGVVTRRQPSPPNRRSPQQPSPPASPDFPGASSSVFPEPSSPGFPGASPPGSPGAPSCEFPGAPPSSAFPGALPAVAPHRNAEDAELQWLLRHCPLLAELTSRAASAAVLSRDEQHVLTYTLGHLTRGAEVVNEIFSAVLNADPRAFLKSPLRGYPMSCPKIRSRLPEITATVDCACDFSPETAGMYPNPLLHLEGLRAQGLLSTEPAMLSPLQVERMILDLVRSQQELQRLQGLVRDLEARLLGLMQHQHVSQLITPAGTVTIQGGERLHLSLTASGFTAPSPSPPPSTSSPAVSPSSTSSPPSPPSESPSPAASPSASSSAISPQPASSLPMLVRQTETPPPAPERSSSPSSEEAGEDAGEE